MFVCYLQAAFEVNTGSVTNTWGDEYDTYIHADNSLTIHFDKLEQPQALVPLLFVIEKSSITSEKSVLWLPNKDAADPPPKLFLSYRSLLI